MPRPQHLETKLRTIRIALGLSQRQFGRWIGVSSSLVKQIEGGQKHISIEFALRLALALADHSLPVGGFKSR
jgi:transcriptional regulator with XRE-family HTH domain